MHISPVLVEAVLRGDLSRQILIEIGKEHLETLCPVCARGVAALDGGAGAAAGPGTEPCPDPVEAVRRRLGLTERQLRDEEATAREWLKRFLRRVPANRRCGTIRNAYKRYRGALFGTLLLEEARRAIRDDPEESLSLAEAALVSCEVTHPSEPDPQVRVPALAVRGNAKRALGRLREAEHDLRGAVALLDRSELEDLGIAAEVERYLGSLHRDQGRQGKAIRHLERAVALYRLMGDHEKTAATLLKVGLVNHSRHQAEAAVASAQEALELLASSPETWLRAYAHYNLALFLHSRGDVDRAEEELAAHENLIAAGGEGLVFRTGWLRARIAWSRDDLATAEHLFRAASAGALDRGLRYEAGLLSLELALVHLVQDRTSPTKELVAEALLHFRGEEEVERETRAALELLEAAVRRDALTRELVERAVASLEEGRHGGRAPAGRAS